MNTKRRQSQVAELYDYFYYSEANPDEGEQMNRPSS